MSTIDPLWHERYTHVETLRHTSGRRRSRRRGSCGWLPQLAALAEAARGDGCGRCGPQQGVARWQHLRHAAIGSGKVACHGAGGRPGQRGGRSVLAGGNAAAPCAAARLPPAWAACQPEPRPARQRAVACGLGVRSRGCRRSVPAAAELRCSERGKSHVPGCTQRRLPCDVSDPHTPPCRGTAICGQQRLQQAVHA